MSTPRIAMTAPVGDGDDVILGPSLGTSTILWDDVLPGLTDRYRISAFDLPGHGAAPAPTDAFTVADVADAVIAAADELGIGTFRYAGVSFGGAVGLELLIRYPERVRQAAIVCSSAVFAGTTDWNARAAQVRTQGTGSLVVGSAQRWFAPDSIANRPVLTGRLLHALRDADDEGYSRCCEALAQFDVSASLPSIAAPVLAVWGQYDEVTPESCANQIAEGVQSGRTARIADASHLAPAEQPDAVTAVLRDFFEGPSA